MFHIVSLLLDLLALTHVQAILTREVGVGKTAIMNGLAQCIQLGEFPYSMKGKHFLSLDLAAFTLLFSCTHL